jgi:hypothetical protein
MQNYDNLDYEISGQQAIIKVIQASLFFTELKRI